MQPKRSRTSTGIPIIYNVLEEEAEAQVGGVLLHDSPRLEHQRLLLLAEDDRAVALRERHACR